MGATTISVRVSIRRLLSVRFPTLLLGVLTTSFWGLAIVLFAGASCCAPKGGNASSDRVEFENVPPGEEWGVLLDGTTATGAVDDRVETGSDSELVLENFQSGPDSAEEVIAVTRDRALDLIEDAPWTDDKGDVVRIEFDKAIEIPVTIWIVKGPYESGVSHALEHVVTANSFWQRERVGIQIQGGSIEFVDATQNPNAAYYYDFKCDRDRQFLETQIGRRPNRINIYRVETVNNSAFAADACAFGSGFVALGESTEIDLLAHEVGHNFNLEHTDDLPGLGTGNLMASFSTDREFMTEGQIFRAHVDPDSVVNALYAARPGKPVRRCGHDDVTRRCPALATRIWPDVAAQPHDGGGHPSAVPTPAASSSQPDSEELARRWLLRNCELGVADLLGRMLTLADAVDEILVAAFRRGPPPDLVAKSDRASRARFELRRRSLADPNSVGLSHTDLARVAEISEANYIARERSSFQLRYRAQALRGLLAVRPDRALPLLRREAGDPDSPLRDIAARLLESHPNP
jgi:hypothetical protein